MNASSSTGRCTGYFSTFANRYIRAVTASFRLRGSAAGGVRRGPPAARMMVRTHVPGRCYPRRAQRRPDRRSADHFCRTTQDNRSRRMTRNHRDAGAQAWRRTPLTMRHVVVMVTTSPRDSATASALSWNPLHGRLRTVATRFMSSRHGTRWSPDRRRNTGSDSTSIDMPRSDR